MKTNKKSIFLVLLAPFLSAGFLLRAQAPDARKKQAQAAQTAAAVKKQQATAPAAPQPSAPAPSTTVTTTVTQPAKPPTAPTTTAVTTTQTAATAPTPADTKTKAATDGTSTVTTTQVTTDTTPTDAKAKAADEAPAVTTTTQITATTPADKAKIDAATAATPVAVTTTQTVDTASTDKAKADAAALGAPPAEALPVPSVPPTEAVPPVSTALEPVTGPTAPVTATAQTVTVPLVVPAAPISAAELATVPPIAPAPVITPTQAVTVPPVVPAAPIPAAEPAVVPPAPAPVIIPTQAAQAPAEKVKAEIAALPAPVPAGPRTPVTITPKEAETGITPVRRRAGRRRRPAISIIDTPKTPEEKRVIEQALAVPETGIIEEQKKEADVSLKKLKAAGEVFLSQYTAPWQGFDTQETVEMNFENKELSALLKFLEDNLNITFILDDYIEPQRVDGTQPLAGTKISFRSNVPLTLRQVWELGTTFLEMAGFSIIPTTLPRTYRVTLSASKDKPSANREPLPTFIGTQPDILPDSDLKIRYVYFAENAELTTISQIVEALKSGSAGPLIEFPQLRAVMITDKSANIKSLVQILQEIDRVTLPETLAIIRLKHTDARNVRELYYKLIGKDPQNPVFNPFGRQRKLTTTQYFSEATRVFEEPRTNSLIVLGTRENIKRFEDFVVKQIDRTLDLPFSPLHIIQLRYIDAASIAKILNDVIQKFNADPANAAAAAVGGVRDFNKFFRPSVRITEEPSGNRLIINADYDEYLKLRKIIEDLDVEQPQVAIKVLILNVDLTDDKEFGTQLRNSIQCCDGTGGTTSILGPNINFQSAQLGPVITRDTAGTPPQPVNGAERLLGNLINLASSSQIGSTLVTLGKDIFGFWGLFRALERLTRVSVVANPFLVTTHKYKAEVKVGEIRRVETAIVQGQTATEATGDLEASLRVVITPQISYDDMVTLTIYIELSQFSGEDLGLGPTRFVRKVSTEALLANREVLAVGGLIRDIVAEDETKVPLLGDIPGIGWLFKSKSKSVTRTSLLILISPEIIKPLEPEVAQRYTYTKINDAKQTLYEMRNKTNLRDPIHRWFFNEHKEKEASAIDKFVSIQQRYVDESQKQAARVVAVNDQKQAQPKKDSLLDFIDSHTPHEGVKT